MRVLVLLLIPAVLGAQPASLISVSAGFDGRTIDARTPLALHLSRPLTVSDGRLAVLLDKLDVTALCTASERTLTYAPSLTPLPEGETLVTVYLISNRGVWSEIGRFALRVAAQPAPSPRAPFPFQFMPSLMLGLKSQPAVRYFPETNRPPRDNYNDVVLQAVLRTGYNKGRLMAQTQFDLAGTSYRNERLRFGTLGPKAPEIDLAGYLMQLQAGESKFSLGHASYGSLRHLVSNFFSRGLTLSTPLGKQADFSAAVMNGSSVVGWDNFAGVDERRHRIVSGVLGLTPLAKSPGALRLEAGVLYGAVLPLAGFNQGVVNDAERSRGASVRLLAADKSQRARLDAGFSRSAFLNPNDPLLGRSMAADALVRVREETRNARYVEASYSIIKERTITESKKADLALSYKHEQIDPQYRSVGAAFQQADRLQNQIDLTGRIGDASATLSHARSEDNLAGIPSILSSNTRRTMLASVLPVSSFVRGKFLPRLSYSLDRVQQFGVAAPRGGEFTDPSQIPDQASDNHAFNAEWNTAAVRFGYRFNHSFQDNRQFGRQLADFAVLVHAFTGGWTPNARLDVNFDLGMERARNLELTRRDHTLRAGLSTTWRIRQTLILTGNISTTGQGDPQQIRRSRTAEFDSQLAWSTAWNRGRWRKLQTQVFVRYSHRYNHAWDRQFGFQNLLRNHTFNGGLNLTFF